MNMPPIKISHLILVGFIILGGAVWLDKDLEIIDLLARVLENLISGYLGYLVKSLED